MSLGIVFSGQGSQYPEMFNKLSLHKSNAVTNLATKLNLSLMPCIDLGHEQLFENKFAQPLIVGYEYLAWQMIAPYLPAPTAMTGYSLGEISAFASSAALPLDDLLSLTKIRSNLMSACGEHQSCMAAISGLNFDKILATCNQFDCYISIINGSDQYVIGGLNDNLTNCIDYIANLEQNIKVTKLDVAVASHTPILKTAGEKFYTELEKYNDCHLSAKIVSGVSANVHYNPMNLMNELSKQVYTTIQFNKAIRVMYELGTTVILEIGPGRALANIIKKYNLSLKVKSVDDFNSVDGLINWVNKNVNMG